MHVPRGRDQRAVVVDGPHVLRGTALVRVLRVVGVGELAVVAAAAPHVEDGIRLAVLHVHPDRPRGLDVLCRGRARRDEVDVVGDPHLLTLRRVVVEHVVEEPAVGGLVRVAVAGRELEIRLLLADREEALGQAGHRGVGRRQVQPHRVVQVDDVDARRLAVRVDEVGADADDPAVFFRLLRLRAAVRDVVLTGFDGERTDLEVQALGAGLDRVVHRRERRDVLGVRRHVRLRRARLVAGLRRSGRRTGAGCHEKDGGESDAAQAGRHAQESSGRTPRPGFGIGLRRHAPATGGRHPRGGYATAAEVKALAGTTAMPPSRSPTPQPSCNQRCAGSSCSAERARCRRAGQRPQVIEAVAGRGADRVIAARDADDRAVPQEHRAFVAPCASSATSYSPWNPKPSGRSKR